MSRIGADLCDALAHAHARGVIHRDLKPQNVMVVAEPAAGVGFAKLTDFGVAHLVSGDMITRTGDVVGTLAYMAPEQAEGARVTPACDVYSLALTLYEAWTGRNPVRAGGPAATARRLGRPLPSLGSQRRDLPRELCDAIDDALDVDPARRPSPAELRAELRAVQSELTDEGGLVEPETLRRVGLPTTRRTRRLFSRRDDGRGAAPAASSARTRALPPACSAAPSRARSPARWVRLAERAGAGLLAGGLVLGVLGSLGPDPSFSPAAAAGAAALATALLPRIGWMLTVFSLCAWLVSPEADRQGTALVLAAAAAPIPFLLPRAGLLWSVPVFAPLLGTVALGPAFIGIAALAPTPWRRAGLAIAGFWWLVLGEAITGKALLSRLARRHAAAGRLGGLHLRGRVRRPPAAHHQHRARAARRVGGVRGRAAARGPRPLARRWTSPAPASGSSALIVAQVALGDALAADVALDQARGAVAGALLAAVVALSVSQVVAPAEGWRAPRITTA